MDIQMAIGAPLATLATAGVIYSLLTIVNIYRREDK